MLNELENDACLETYLYCDYTYISTLRISSLRIDVTHWLDRGCKQSFH